MLTGDPLFPGEDELELHQQILQMSINYPPFFTPEEVQFLTALLERDPEKRLGCLPQAEEYIKYHFYFTNKDVAIDWDAIEKKKLEPPFKPDLTDENDVKYFDEEFTATNPDLDSYGGEYAINFAKVYKNEFKGFSYTNLSYDE